MHTWKIKINEIPAGAERLQMVVLDKQGRVLDRSAMMIGLNSAYKIKLPAEVLIGIEMKGADAFVFMDMAGSSTRFTITDPLNAKEKGPAGLGKSWSKSAATHWDGKFLHLLSDSRTVGSGSKPFPEASRILALHFCTETEADEATIGDPDGEKAP